MNKQEAEAEIVRLVKDIDAIRVGPFRRDRDDDIAAIDAQIKELKKITGPRKIVGEMHL